MQRTSNDYACRTKYTKNVALYVRAQFSPENITLFLARSLKNEWPTLYWFSSVYPHFKVENVAKKNFTWSTRLKLLFVCSQYLNSCIHQRRLEFINTDSAKIYDEWQHFDTKDMRSHGGSDMLENISAFCRRVEDLKWSQFQKCQNFSTFPDFSQIYF